MSQDVRIGYLSPKLEVRAHTGKGGQGVFALQEFAKDEILVAWGGRVLTFDELRALPPDEQGHTMQIDEGLYLGPLSMLDAADYINHSCTPNAGLRGQIVLVAMRAIRAGEEICFDYAMCDGSAFDEFECGCGTSYCRGRVSGDDWRRPELWARYDGYFSPYLQRRIDRLKLGMDNKDKGA